VNLMRYQHQHPHGREFEQSALTVRKRVVGGVGFWACRGDGGKFHFIRWDKPAPSTHLEWPNYTTACGYWQGIFILPPAPEVPNNACLTCDAWLNRCAGDAQEVKH